MAQIRGMTTSRRRFLGALGGAGITLAGSGALSSLLVACDSGGTGSGAASSPTTFAAPDPAVPWWMQGVFAPVSEEVGATQLEVVGSLPPELTGTFVRNGSNPAAGPSSHWFMGDGMVHGVRLEGGAAAWYRNRYVDTTILRAGSGLTAAGPPGGPNNQGNVSMLAHGDRLLALGEIGFPYEIDPATLETIGPYDYGGRLTTAMTAHPKVDPATGDLHFFGYGFVPPYLTYHVASADGSLRSSQEVDLGRPVMMHDFNVTDRDVVFWDLPVIFDMDAATSGSGMPFQWRPEAGARVGVMPLGGPTSAIRWVEIEPCFVYHSTNAYRDGDEVVVDVCRQPSAMTASTDTRPSRVERWRIDTSGSELALRAETLSEQRMDLPTIDRRHMGRDYRHGWYAEVVSDGPDGTQFPGIIHLDTATGELDRWSPGGWLAAGEGVLAPTGPGEGEGWLLAFTTDRRTMTSSLVVLDALDLAAGPVAEVRLPARVPVGFHGAWLAEA